MFSSQDRPWDPEVANLSARSQPADAVPSEPEAALQKWTVAVLAALGVILVLIIISTVLIHAVQRAPARPVVNVVHVSGAPAVQAVVDLSVTPGIKPGPGGKLHDAFSQTTFTVKAGHPVKLVIDNTDTVAHSIVATAAGVDIIVRPGTHTYTLMVRHQGSYVWHCGLPCDPYSMSHLGYMMGKLVSD